MGKHANVYKLLSNRLNYNFFFNEQNMYIYWTYIYISYHLFSSKYLMYGPRFINFWLYIRGQINES